LKYYYFILFTLLLACSHQSEFQNITSKSTFWISENLDYYSIDSIFGSGKTIYGSGYLLSFSPDQKVNFLTADFYWKNDSLYQGGEPGIIMKSGEWSIKDSTLLLNERLLEKSIMMLSDTIGEVQKDTFQIENDTLISYKRNKLIPLKKGSEQLKDFVKGIEKFHLNRIK